MNYEGCSCSIPGLLVPRREFNTQDFFYAVDNANALQQRKICMLIAPNDVDIDNSGQKCSASLVTSQGFVEPKEDSFFRAMFDETLKKATLAIKQEYEQEIKCFISKEQSFI